MFINVKYVKDYDGLYIDKDLFLLTGTFTFIEYSHAVYELRPLTASDFYHDGSKSSTK